MERLHYIDEHAIDVAAGRARTWDALQRVVCKGSDSPPVGFSLESAVAPERLALRGRHWFSIYALVFELDETGPDRTRLRAKSWADFPGLHGKIYRALVIGTGGHRVVVRGLLRRIAAAA